MPTGEAILDLTPPGRNRIPEHTVTHGFSDDVERLLRELANYYDVRVVERDEILSYLRGCPDLLEVIPTAINAARKYFPEAELTLQVYRDPEIDHSYLLINVRVSRYDDTVMERIERAESEFLHLLRGKRGWLIMNTDFIAAWKTNGV